MKALSMMTAAVTLSTAVTLGAMSAPASAAPCPFGSGGNTDSLTVSTNCNPGTGPGGNYTVDDAELLHPGFPWKEVDVLNFDDNGGFNTTGDNGILQVEYIVDPEEPTESKAGTWSVNFSGKGIIAVKAGPNSFGYLVELAENGGTWNTNDLGNKGISNIRAYQQVPEPLTLLGSGAALGFGVLMKRKRDQQQQEA